MFIQSVVTLLGIDKCLAANGSAAVRVFVENICLFLLVKLELTVPAMTALSGPKKATDFSLTLSSFL